VHGLAVGMMLPAVFRFNSEDAEAARLYDELDRFSALGAKLDGLLNLAGLPRTLADCGVSPSAIPQLATEAAKQWTARFNPRPLAEKDFVKLYEEAFVARGNGKSYLGGTIFNG